MTTARSTVRRNILLAVAVLALAVVVGELLRTFVVGAYVVKSESMLPTLNPGDHILINRLSRHVGLRHGFKALSAPVPGDIVIFSVPADAPAGGVPPHYVKRCCAGPGDTVLIEAGEVRVNGALFPRRRKSGEEVLPSTARDPIVAAATNGINRDWIGPFVVPRKGLTIPLRSAETSLWEKAIEEEGHSLGTGADGTAIIDGAAAGSYTFSRDYYFVIGDNWTNSVDSRFFGPVPESLIDGTALMVYWPQSGRK
jgi:signal peptidase I